MKDIGNIPEVGGKKGSSCLGELTQDASHDLQYIAVHLSQFDPLLVLGSLTIKSL